MARMRLSDPGVKERLQSRRICWEYGAISVVSTPTCPTTWRPRVHVATPSSTAPPPEYETAKDEER